MGVHIGLHHAAIAPNRERVLFIPGGGFVYCDVDEHAYGRALTPLERDVFICQYPTRFEYTYFEALQYIAAFLEENVQKSGDILVAHSAGAHLLCNVISSNVPKSTALTGALKECTVFLVDGYYGCESTPIFTVGFVTGSRPNNPLANLITYDKEQAFTRAPRIVDDVKRLVICVGDKSLQPFVDQATAYSILNGQKEPVLFRDSGHFAAHHARGFKNPLVDVITRT